MKIVFHNVAQGIVHSEKAKGQYRPDLYADFYESLSPDILCLAEVPFDDKGGASPFADMVATRLSLPFKANVINDKSWLLENKWYGLTTISRWPINEHKSVPMTTPSVCAVWEGKTVQMHNKCALSCTIAHPQEYFEIINFHGFPFHRFGRSVTEFPTQIEEMKGLFAVNTPLVVCGDFNNSGIPLEKLITPILSGEAFQDTIRFSTNEQLLDNAKGQIDHILCSKHFDFTEGRSRSGLSDHPSLEVALAFNASLRL